MILFIVTATIALLTNLYIYHLGLANGAYAVKGRKFIVPFKGRVAVGDTVEFPGDPNAYAVLGINEDGIVVKRIT